MSDETRKIIGRRRFTKLEQVTVTHEPGPVAFKPTPHDGPKGADVIDATPWLRDRLAAWVADAERVLTAAGLPTEPQVRTVTETKAGGTVERHADLSLYVEGLGYAHDSDEGLAARMVTLVDRMRWLPAGALHDLQAQATQIATFIHVYRIDSADHGWRGRKGAENRWSASEARRELAGIINRLADERDALGDSVPPADLWPMLYSELEKRELSPDDSEESCYYYGGSAEKITFDAFRRRIQRVR